MLTAFTAGLLLITVSELGDKTFFIAVVLSMRHSRWLVFTGVAAALAAMTILSVVMGQAIAFLPALWVDIATIALFAIFGCKLLYDASRMPDRPGVTECQEAVEMVDKSIINRRKQQWGVFAEAFTLTFLAEWGDRTQFATIALAADQSALGVTLGAILGHMICAAIAVLGGCLIAGRISERTITGLGGALFLLFAAIAWVELQWV
ncbi:TMEM165/GDT1 family protein [Oscillatoria sp. FACHB-1407]|uniref:TMEM165/GDT1 family protein n=1 Tax=Oscillatoria sp. FACHB-1407 TaxID=2692847 RepID=UPI001681CB7C|nr:TMEM165/GDT1 family protein [Oscillatoria sp. FACHB-1407]MBD2462215.1 TMEM165/GDT1 family protein [Oscillatoria sp. FACHB-1407]